MTTPLRKYPYMIELWFERFIWWAYLRKIYGKKCGSFDGECIVCREWAKYDDYFNFWRT